MDCDVERRRTRSGRMATQLIVQPISDISDPENESDSKDDSEKDTKSSDVQNYSSNDDDRHLSSFLIRQESTSGDDDTSLSSLVNKPKLKCEAPVLRKKTENYHIFRERKMTAPHADDMK